MVEKGKEDDISHILAKKQLQYSKMRQNQRERQAARMRLVLVGLHSTEIDRGASGGQRRGSRAGEEIMGEWVSEPVRKSGMDASRKTQRIVWRTRWYVRTRSKRQSIE